MRSKYEIAPARLKTTALAPFAALCLLALGACAPGQLTSGINAGSAAVGAVSAADPTVAKFVARVNATIAKDAAKVAAAYCPKVQLVAGAPASVASALTKGKVSMVISDAQTFVRTFCGAPPKNASQALSLGIQILDDAAALGLIAL